LATSGDFLLATSGDFLMAMDSSCGEQPAKWCRGVQLEGWVTSGYRGCVARSCSSGEPGRGRLAAAGLEILEL
jgi:hypothetical protein